MKYVCDVCGWEYDEEQGYPEGGIAPGTKWEDVPEDFECPLCSVVKISFQKQSKISLMPRWKTNGVFLSKINQNQMERNQIMDGKKMVGSRGKLLIPLDKVNGYDDTCLVLWD